MFGGGAALDGRSLGVANGAVSLGGLASDCEDVSSNDGSDASGDSQDDSADGTSDTGELLLSLFSGTH